VSPIVVFLSLGLSVAACLGAAWAIWRASRPVDGRTRRAVDALDARVSALESAWRQLETEWASQWDKFRKLYARLRARWDREMDLSNPADGAGSVPPSSLQGAGAVTPQQLRTAVLAKFHAERGGLR